MILLLVYLIVKLHLIVDSIRFIITNPNHFHKLITCMIFLFSAKI